MFAEFFAEWAGAVKLYRTVITKNAANVPVESEQAINAGADILAARYVTTSVQTNTGDKFALSEVGKIICAYQRFFVRTTSGDPAVTTDTTVYPDSTWYIKIGTVKYHIEGVDDIGNQHEDYVFTYRKAR